MKPMKTVLLLCYATTLTVLAQGNPEWYGFAPYPGARQLCGQVVMEQPGLHTMEIRWHSYATADAVAKVVAFYENTKVTDEKKDADSVTFHLDKDTSLSVHAASGSYPGCDNKPKSNEATVIVVSHAIRR
jgi:hypothetical protein